MSDNLLGGAPTKRDRNLSRTVGNRSALTLLVLAVSTGCASTPQVRSGADERADRATAEQVYEALAADPIDYFWHVDVTARDGVVTLSGVVWEPQEIPRAQRITARVRGVARVVNQLELNQEDR
jgi:hyperosmotically inducible protein